MLPCCDNDNLINLPLIIEKSPHTAFTADLFFVVNNGSKFLCHSDCNTMYKIHPDSPLTKELRWIIENVCLKSDSYYIDMFEAYRKICLSELDEMFNDFCHDIACELNVLAIEKEFEGTVESDLANVNDKTTEFNQWPFNILVKLVTIVKWSMVFHKNCVVQSLPTVFKKISEALYECNKRYDVFSVLSKHAREMLQFYSYEEDTSDEF